jgi:cation/acetate symporter
MSTGFTVAVLAIVAGEASWLGLHSTLAGAFGIPAGFIATIVASLMAPSPSRHALEILREMRFPGGETVHDREMRLLRLKQRQRPL